MIGSKVIGSSGGGGGAVDSVFSRTGTVTASTGDYTASKITNDSSVTGTNIDDALDNLFTSLGSQFGETLTNATGGIIAQFKAIYIRSDGTGIDYCDADIASQGRCFGLTLEGGIANGAQVSVGYEGKIVGAVTGLGFTAGDIVYVSETAGDLVVTPPSDSGDTVFQIGHVAPNEQDLYIDKKYITTI